MLKSEFELGSSSSVITVEEEKKSRGSASIMVVEEMKDNQEINNVEGQWINNQKTNAKTTRLQRNGSARNVGKKDNTSQMPNATVR